MTMGPLTVVFVVVLVKAAGRTDADDGARRLQYPNLAGSGAWFQYISTTCLTSNRSKSCVFSPHVLCSEFELEAWREARNVIYSTVVHVHVQIGPINCAIVAASSEPNLHIDMYSRFVNVLRISPAATQVPQNSEEPTVVSVYANSGV